VASDTYHFASHTREEAARIGVRSVDHVVDANDATRSVDLIWMAGGDMDINRGSRC
jgi:hypothetical protein